MRLTFHFIALVTMGIVLASAMTNEELRHLRVVGMTAEVRVTEIPKRGVGSWLFGKGNTVPKQKLLQVEVPGTFPFHYMTTVDDHDQCILRIETATDYEKFKTWLKEKNSMEIQELKYKAVEYVIPTSNSEGISPSLGDPQLLEDVRLKQDVYLYEVPLSGWVPETLQGCQIFDDDETESKYYLVENPSVQLADYNKQFNRQTPNGSQEFVISAILAETEAGLENTGGEGSRAPAKKTENVNGDRLGFLTGPYVLVSVRAEADAANATQELP